MVIWYFCTKRASKIIVLPKELSLSVSIGTFLTNYDITNIKLKLIILYSIVQKRTKLERQTPMETTAPFTGGMKFATQISPLLDFNEPIFLFQVSFQKSKTSLVKVKVCLFGNWCS